MKHDQSRLEKEFERYLGRAHEGYAEPTYVCPFCRTRGHATDPGRLHVNLRKEMACCHRCGYGSKNLASLLFQISGRMPDLLVREARESGFLRTVERLLETEAAAKKSKKVKCELPDEFIPLTYPPKKMIATRCAEYLESRGVDQQTVENLNIGYAAKGALSGMLIFPIYMGKKLVFYTTRRVIAGPGPKSIHSEIPRDCIMFNANALAKARRAFINEGPFDALSWPRKLGVGVAVLGHKLSVGQAQVLLGAKNIEEYVFCFDADVPASTLESAELLSNMIQDDRMVTVILLKKGDPNSERESLHSYFVKRKAFNSSLLVESLIGG